MVAHFDKTFDLGLSAQDKSDLVAYLDAIGAGSQPFELDGLAGQIDEQPVLRVYLIVIL